MAYVSYTLPPSASDFIIQFPKYLNILYFFGAIHRLIQSLVKKKNFSALARHHLTLSIIPFGWVVNDKNNGYYELFVSCLCHIYMLRRLIHTILHACRSDCGEILWGTPFVLDEQNKSVCFFMTHTKMSENSKKIGFWCILTSVQIEVWTNK